MHFLTLSNTSSEQSPFIVQHAPGLTAFFGETYCINFLIDDETEYQPFSVKIKNVEKLLTSYKLAENAWRLKKNGYEYVCLSEIYKRIKPIFNQLVRQFVCSSSCEYSKKHSKNQKNQ